MNVALENGKTSQIRFVNHALRSVETAQLSKIVQVAKKDGSSMLLDNASPVRQIARLVEMGLVPSVKLSTT